MRKKEILTDAQEGNTGYHQREPAASFVLRCFSFCMSVEASFSLELSTSGLRAGWGVTPTQDMPMYRFQTNPAH